LKRIFKTGRKTDDILFFCISANHARGN